MSPGKGSKVRFASPIGFFEIEGTPGGIVSVRFLDGGPSMKKSAENDRPCLKKCIKQLDEYFRGTRKSFSLKLELRGTEFQKRVWRELLKVPFGKTISYRDVARAVGHERAARAVGGACHQNPLAVIVPCHRVVGASGRLIGYGGGLWRKEWLIKHEKNK